MLSLFGGYLTHHTISGNAHSEDGYLGGQAETYRSIGNAKQAFSLNQIKAKLLRTSKT